MFTPARSEPVNNRRVVPSVAQRLHTRKMNRVDCVVDFGWRLWLAPEETAVRFFEAHQFRRLVLRRHAPETRVGLDVEVTFRVEWRAFVVLFGTTGHRFINKTPNV